MVLFIVIEKNDSCFFVLWGGVMDMVLIYEEREDLRRMMKWVIGGIFFKYFERYEWRIFLYCVYFVKLLVLFIYGLEDKNVLIDYFY